VQLRLLRQRVVMTAQKAQADVLLHRLHYALPGWEAAAERRDAQDEFHSAAQARAWADGDFGADHGFAFGGVGRPGHKGRGRGPTGVEAGGGGFARALGAHLGIIFRLADSATKI
jgi:hypothetical protein